MDLSKTQVNLIVAAKIIVTVCASVVFVYSTFATVKYVDEKHIGVMGVLVEIKERVTSIESLQRELLRRSRYGK